MIQITQIKLYLIYYDKETIYFILYKYRSFFRMMTRGCCLCWRKPQDPQKTYVVKQVTTTTYDTGQTGDNHHIRHRELNPDW